MRFGICIGDDVSRVKQAKEIGFDYIEAVFSVFAGEDEEKYRALQKATEEAGIRVEACNCFLPGSVPITGESTDDEKLSAYVERGMKRGKELGLQTVVLGSSAARNIPAGYSYRRAAEQIGHALREVIAPLAEKYGITVVMEPLSESNIINTVKEGVLFAAMSGSESVQGLGDLFHMAEMNDAVENIRDIGACLRHSHISEPGTRNYPTDPDAYDYKPFLSILGEVGCPRCSIEAGTKNFAEDAAKALALLRKLG